VNNLAIEFLANTGERLLPREHVHVVAVDKRAVDVEEDGLDLHAMSCVRVVGIRKSKSAAIWLYPPALPRQVRRARHRRRWQA
jgi:hypothetical protein